MDNAYYSTCSNFSCRSFDPVVRGNVLYHRLAATSVLYWALVTNLNRQNDQFLADGAHIIQDLLTSQGGTITVCAIPSADSLQIEVATRETLDSLDGWRYRRELAADAGRPNMVFNFALSGKQMTARIKDLGRKSWVWLRGREPVVLLVLLGMALAVWGFLIVADEVLEGDTQAFDKWVVRSMRQSGNVAEPIGPGWLQEMGRDATAFGGIAALALFTIAIGGYLWLDGKSRLMWFLVTSTVGGVLVSTGLKHLFDRPRPDIVPHLSIVYTSSFPSGHSMLAAVVYLTLGSLLAAASKRLAVKLYVIGVAVVLTALVGISRVYLGVHYPTDVLAGWIAGLSWALLSWLVARWLQSRHQIEQPKEEAAETPEQSVDDAYA